MIGIYKITSPTNKIYIGQSINIPQRFTSYKNINQNVSHKRLKSSFFKHDVENHKFEIIEICLIDKLNERERYWQEYYDVCGKNGLNCKLTITNDKSGYLSENTKLKISKAHIGKKLSKTHCINIGLAKKGIKLSKKHIENIRKGNIGKIISEEHKEALRNSRKNELISNVGKKGKDHKLAKSVICTKTGKIWDTITDCSLEINVSVKNLSRYLNGTRRNYTTIIYFSNN